MDGIRGCRRLEATAINSAIWLWFSGDIVNDVQQLTEELARRVLGWKAAADRFIIGNRRWMPRWQFQPCRKPQRCLLEAANPEDYTMGGRGANAFWVQVRLHSGGVGGVVYSFEPTSGRKP
jgi:hypothetical protein